MLDVIEIKPLEGWLTFEEVGTLLGLTRQSIYNMVTVTREIHPDDVRVITKRPVYLVRESVALALKAERDAEAAKRAARKAA